MQKNPIGWVEIPVSDLDRAEKFYEAFMDIKCERQAEKEGYLQSWMPMDMDGYGSATTLMKGEGYNPSHDGANVYFTAPGGSVEKALVKAQEMGVRVLAPKMSLGEHGFMAMVEDSEGNAISLHSMES